MREINSRPVSYRRGGSVLFTAKATVYEKTTDEMIAYGVSLDARRVDYIFLKSDVPIGFEPEADTDQIYDAKLDLLCKVTPFGEESHFRWVSHQRLSVRIHTAAATYSLPPSEYELAAIASQSLVGTVMATTTNLPLIGILTDSQVGTVGVESELAAVYTGSMAGELEPELQP